MGQLVRPTGRTSWTDQLDRSARQISWMDQFFLFEALASSHIRRFSFQFVHCCSFRVRRRPCFCAVSPHVVPCICHTQLSFVFYVKLRIWHVPACEFSCQFSPTCFSECGTSSVNQIFYSVLTDISVGLPKTNLNDVSFNLLKSNFNGFPN